MPEANQAAPAGGPTPLPEHPKAEDYRLLVEREWADIHHSRVQEWTALGVVTGAHLIILQLLSFGQDKLTPPLPWPILAACGSCLGIVFALLGALVTCRHRHLMFTKLNWIYQAEARLGLVEIEAGAGGVIPRAAQMEEGHRWQRFKLMWPRLFSTSWMILWLYLMLILLDALALALFATSGTAPAL